MTENNGAKVEQCDREAAADFRDDVWGYPTSAKFRNGSEDSHRLVQAFAAARIAERERCATIADAYADEKDVMAMSACFTPVVASYREGERTAQQIAEAIRGDA